MRYFVLVMHSSETFCVNVDLPPPRRRRPFLQVCTTLDTLHTNNIPRFSFWSKLDEGVRPASPRGGAGDSEELCRGGLCQRVPADEGSAWYRVFVEWHYWNCLQGTFSLLLGSSSCIFFFFFALQERAILTILEAYCSIYEKLILYM